jgi:CheY-like chemotaxis protein
MGGPKRTTNGTRRKGSIVLLVMPDRHMRARFAEVLVAHGYLVLEASEWSSGLVKAMTLGPDAVALELSLLAPGATSAARFLKTHERTSHIPILALNDRTWRAPELRAIGFDRVLDRPCSQFELVEAFRKLFELRETPQRRVGA